MSSTHARTTSPTSWRRASRPTDSAITRMASWGSMKQSGITQTVGGGVDGTFLQFQRLLTALERVVITGLMAESERRARPGAPVGERQVERFDGHRDRLRERLRAALEV